MTQRRLNDAELLALHAKQRGVDIAADFGVSPSTISKINKRKVNADVHFAP